MIDNGMTIEREAQILEGAITKWGSRNQTFKAIEEMAELIQALLKFRAADEAGWVHTDPFPQLLGHVREEMADVSIMLRQLELIYGDYADEEIEKLERLEQRIKEDK